MLIKLSSLKLDRLSLKKYLYIEKDLSTLTDVSGAYLKAKISAGVYISNSLGISEILPDKTPDIFFIVYFFRKRC